jgi:hypothetical protein
MKRSLIALVVCVAAFFVTREVVQRVGEVFSGVGAQSPSLQVQSSQPVQAQTIVTSLPPLTNFISQRPSQKIRAPELPASTNELKTAATAAASPKKSAKPPRQDPDARVALSLVGVDPAAEEYWAMAINDPSLSESEREDLIEDLNEEGFVDPKNPSLDELPLIINRLVIIEEYAPSAMDDTNARSFAEAYKDLAHMYARLTSQQPP